MRRHWKMAAVAVVLTVAALILELIPVSSLAAPNWDVTVVDETGKPVEGMTVRESWQNYSVEESGHEADRLSDANGHATFAAQISDYSYLAQLVGTASSFVHFNVHSSYGPHAYVFAFGRGLEGTATTGEIVTDWTGHPTSMHSRVVVSPLHY